jgi:3-hydroxybutyryl-CoA dehydrogenase
MKIENIRRVAMIGAGTMGAGMSLCFANAGFEVTLYDVREDALDLGLQRIKASLEVMVKERVVSQEQAAATQGSISTTMELNLALQNTQFVLEAAPEDLKLKQALFRQMDQICDRSVILATNTSGLSVSSIAAVCQFPDRVGGMHWVNPPELVPLVEVIKGEKTTEPTLKTIFEIGEKLGKVPVVIRKDVPGFGLNRLQFSVLREALHLVENGVLSARDVDRVMKCGLGFRYSWLGPLETADLGGLDVFHSVATYLFNDLSDEKKPSEWFSSFIEQGKLGIKTGQGFYDYEDCSREQILRRRDIYFLRQWKLIQEVLNNDGAK